MTYNMTGFETSNTLLDLFAGINTASGGLLSHLTLISLSIILFMALMRNNPVPESLFATSMPMAILSLVFFYTGLTTSPVWIILYSVTAAAAAIALYKSNSV